MMPWCYYYDVLWCLVISRCLVMTCVMMSFLWCHDFLRCHVTWCHSYDVMFILSFLWYLIMSYLVISWCYSYDVIDFDALWCQYVLRWHVSWCHSYDISWCHSVLSYDVILMSYLTKSCFILKCHFKSETPRFLVTNPDIDDANLIVYIMDLWTVASLKNPSASWNFYCSPINVLI